MNKIFGWLFAMVAILFVGVAYADDAVEASNDEVVVEVETQDEQSAPVEEVAVADESTDSATEE